MPEAFSNTGFPEFWGLNTGFSDEKIVITGFPESPSPPPFMFRLIILWYRKMIFCNTQLLSFTLFSTFFGILVWIAHLDSAILKVATFTFSNRKAKIYFLNQLILVIILVFSIIFWEEEFKNGHCLHPNHLDSLDHHFDV